LGVYGRWRGGEGWQSRSFFPAISRRLPASRGRQSKIFFAKAFLKAESASNQTGIWASIYGLAGRGGLLQQSRAKGEIFFHAKDWPVIVGFFGAVCSRATRARRPVKLKRAKTTGPGANRPEGASMSKSATQRWETTRYAQKFAGRAARGFIFERRREVGALLPRNRAQYLGPAGRKKDG